MYLLILFLSRPLLLFLFWSRQLLLLFLLFLSFLLVPLSNKQRESFWGRRRSQGRQVPDCRAITSWSDQQLKIDSRRTWKKNITRKWAMEHFLEYVPKTLKNEDFFALITILSWIENNLKFLSMHGRQNFIRIRPKNMLLLRHCIQISRPGFFRTNCTHIIFEPDKQTQKGFIPFDRNLNIKKLPQKTGLDVSLRCEVSPNLVLPHPRSSLALARSKAFEYLRTRIQIFPSFSFCSCCRWTSNASTWFWPLWGSSNQGQKEFQDQIPLSSSCRHQNRA